MTIKLGLIGGGVMGEAILSRLLVREIYQVSEVIVSEPQEARRSFLHQRYGVSVINDNGQMWSQVKETVILAVKPQILSTVIEEVVDMLPMEPSPLMISILTGVSLKQLENSFPGVSIVRAMPNTPATVGAGVTAISCGGHLQPGHHHIATRIFQAIGEVVEVSESLMDAVTGLSGSGPAYVALMVEALADGGVASGLPRAVAKQLALHTVLGSAKLIAETNIHPAELKDQVTSPGGTTIAGLRELERAGFRSAVIEAVKAATERSRELGVY